MQLIDDGDAFMLVSDIEWELGIGRTNIAIQCWREEESGSRIN